MDPRQLVRDYHPAPTMSLVAGTVASPAPATFASPMLVSLTNLSSDYAIPCAWDATNGSTLPTVGAAVLLGFDDNGVGTVIWWNGVYATGTTSPTAVALASNGTITVGYSIVRVNPAVNVTGIILAAGSASQSVTVVNESAFTVTFAASGTSHVADGVSDVIAAVTARSFVYDTGTSLWYREA